MIYVHHNPGNLQYNSYVLAFVRAWHIPIRKEDNSYYSDSWLRVPAIKSLGVNNSSNYTMTNTNINAVSVITIAEDTGALIKFGRLPVVSKTVAPSVIDQILAEAIDISAYELAKQESWPYAAMNDPNQVQMRYAAINGPSAAVQFNPNSNNKLFQQVRQQVGPKPCNCGGKRR